VYVIVTDAAVVPRFASVSSVVYRELPTPATSSTIGTSFVAEAAARPAGRACARARGHEAKLNTATANAVAW
jgi:hypothetical protein